MIELMDTGHHTAIEEIVEVLCAKTQNKDKGFFRTEVAYFLAKMASCQRAVIVTKDRGEVPVNIYALALATSGFGKGYSVNIVEQEFLQGFEKRFIEETMPIIAEKHLWEIADDRAVRNGTDQQEEYDQALKEYNSGGAYAFTFDSATPPAVKQLRNKLLMAKAGSLNLQIDEIGSNLIGSVDVLNLFLELYDQGMVKNKLTKNTQENKRGEEITGKTPTNALLFGTPSKLLDGGQTEDQFYSFLETGYARRCLFGFGQHTIRASDSMTPEEIFHALISRDQSDTVNKWYSHFMKLADATIHGWKMQMPDDVAIELIQYKIACEREADKMKEHEDIRKAEISHRYFKALKLAGAYSFVDQLQYISMENLHRAILLVEESGKAFQVILDREKAYVKLAKYIADVDTEVTHADLLEALPFYSSTSSRRNEMMSLATAWGYKKHIIIKKTFVEGIEFFRGETLKETNLQEIILSHSDNWAYHYEPEMVPFENLDILTQAEGLHWSNHHFKGEHRKEENTIPGFNLITIDVDGGTSLSLVHELLKDYKFITYTTKRHTEEENRFRLMLPTNYHLELDSDEYKEFMNAVMEWLPFPTDEAANQRSKKWETYHNGEFTLNMEGDLLDVLPFIPKTSRHEQYKNSMKSLSSLDNLERWFAARMVSGSRNNHMIKFALALVDSGMNFIDVSNAVHSFNKKLDSPLPTDEIDSTILRSVAQKYKA